MMAQDGATKDSSTPSGWLDFLSKLQAPHDFWVSCRKPNLKWETWLPWNPWKDCGKPEPNYRQVLHSELCLETDFPDKMENWETAQQIMKHLREQGCNYRCHFSGNKSFHIHSLFSRSQFETLNPEQAVRAKKAWVAAVFPKAIADVIDASNLGKKTLILVEGAVHPKSGSQKVLIEKHGDWVNNEMPQEIIEAACKEPIPIQKNYDTSAPNRCLFLEWACENKLPEGQRNQAVAPNLMAAMPEKAEQFASVQGMQLSDVNGWQGAEFSCKQLQEYAGKIGKRSVCDLCLLEGRKNG